MLIANGCLSAFSPFPTPPAPRHPAREGGATKFAINAIGKAARVELQGSGVHVLTVYPGYIATNFEVNKSLGREPRRLNSANQKGVSAELVARDILNGYLKCKREVYTPWYYWMVAKLYQLFPALVEWGMGKKLKGSH